MRKLKIIEHISLDGVIQVSGDDGDFPYGDWTAAYRTPAGRDAMMAAHGERFDLLLGRRTYDGIRSVPYHLSHNSRPKTLPAKRARQPDAVLDHQAGACPH